MDANQRLPDSVTADASLFAKPPEKTRFQPNHRRVRSQLWSCGFLSKRRSWFQFCHWFRLPDGEELETWNWLLKGAQVTNDCSSQSLFALIFSKQSVLCDIDNTSLEKIHLLSCILSTFRKTIFVSIFAILSVGSPKSSFLCEYLNWSDELVSDLIQIWRCSKFSV